MKQSIDKTVKVTGTHYFTDSLINLCRIRNGPSKYKLWVANRIHEILQGSTPSDWHHCPGVLNPADLPSRGLSANELKNSSLWWTGPDFIRNDVSTWPTDAEVHVKDDPEQCKTVEFEEDWKVLSATDCQTKLDWDFVRSLLDKREDWNMTI